MLNSARRKPDTILSAMELLKASKPDYFSHYVLMPLSFSLHQSDFTYPRVLIFGGDGKMIVSFNGSRSQRNYENLEVMCFDDQKAAFEFREITFPKEAQAQISDLSKQEALQPFVISKPNGKSAERDCRMCHAPYDGTVRPNWDIYPHWPSAYGATDDLVFRPTDLPQLSGFNRDYTLKERSRISTFSLSGRYSVLNQNDTDRPNLRMGEVLGRLNGKKIVGDLKRLGKKFSDRKKQFAKALYCPIGNDRMTSGRIVGPVDERLKKIISDKAQYGKMIESRLTDTLGQGPIVWTGGAKDDRDSLRFYYQSLGIKDGLGEFVHGDEESIRLSDIEAIMEPLGINAVRLSATRASWDFVCYVKSSPIRTNHSWIRSAKMSATFSRSPH